MPLNHRDTQLESGEIVNYVAHLQLHMALQARKVLPNTFEGTTPCNTVLYQSQAEYEKLISRQRG